MNDLGLAALVAAVLSGAIGLIEVRFRSSADFKAILGFAFLIYLLVLVVGNTGTTLLAAATLADVTTGGGATSGSVETEKGGSTGPDPSAAVRDAATPKPTAGSSAADKSPTKIKGARLPGPAWFWYAFVGVFGFEALLKNINVTLFGKGVLSIEDWISKARDVAVAAAIASNTRRGFQRSQNLAAQLRNLSEVALGAQVVQLLGKDVLLELDKIAQDTATDPHFVKALALAHQKPDEAEAILRSRK